MDTEYEFLRFHEPPVDRLPRLIRRYIWRELEFEVSQNFGQELAHFQRCYVAPDTTSRPRAELLKLVTLHVATRIDLPESNADS